MSDLVKRLRAWHTPNETITGDVQLYLDAAARIEALESLGRINISARDTLLTRIAALEADVIRFVGQRDKALEFISANAHRIEALEAALREIVAPEIDDGRIGWLTMREIARAALMQRPGQHADQRQGEQPEPDHKR